VSITFDPADALGSDWRSGRWIGRIDRGQGPSPVLVVDGIVHDMVRVAPPSPTSSRRARSIRQRARRSVRSTRSACRSTATSGC
jgi:fumarylacetoacetate (FAA) hydrolase family protein